MVGQGSPQPTRIAPTRAIRKIVPGVRSLLFGLLLWNVLALAAQAAPSPLRLRFEWGGGPRRDWSGQVSIDQGRLADLLPLGIEADEPGALWIEGGQVQIAHRSGRTYDAFDVEVIAEPGAVLTVRLGDRASGLPDMTLTIPIADVINEVYSGELDAQGNRLLVRRAPGDAMRIETQREALVFAPGEIFAFNLRPLLPSVAAGTPLRFVVRLTAARESEVLWSRDHDVKLPGAQEGPLELEFETPLPVEEGAYDVQVLVFEQGFRQRLVNVVLPTPLAERKVQLVVVGEAAPPAPPLDQASWRPVGEINPANPGWWKRLVQLPQLTLIPGWPQGPLRSGDATPVDHPLGAMIRFAEQTTPDDTTWEAYPLPIEQIGAPHLLEVNYPSDAPQHLGISIIEPGASGTVLPIGLDSGVYVSDEAARGAPRVLKHRLIFWPKTKTPMVLLVQRSGRTPAVFSKIRVLAGPERLPSALLFDRPAESRLIAGYMDRPLFPENFSASGVLDEWSGQTIDDWQTFYEGGARLVDYLNYTGFNGLMLTVWGDGSAIYPSDKLRSTPRYDTGLLGTSGSDPQRKDVLEMLMRLFDRNRLRLIPTLQFASPLPELEARLRQGGDDAVGIELIGPSGATWLDGDEAERGLAPYYNPLNGHVQQAMLGVVRELAIRYGEHPAYAGVAVQLAAEGYAQLPGAEWGLDDQTVARFEKETGVEIPDGAGADRFSRRANFLLGPQRSAWLAWRADVLARFYEQMQIEVSQARPGTKLFLAATGVFDGPTAQQQLRPALPQTAKIDQVLLELGLDPSRFSDNPDLVFVRPRRIAPLDPLHARAVDLQINSSSELDAELADAAVQASLFYHPRQRMRLRSFEQQSPFGEANTYALLVAQPSPSGDWNRQRFAHALARRDATMLFDGGWLLPLGQEDALRRMLAVYRQLPADGFRTSAASRQPIMIRTRSDGKQTLIYLVNESPWPVETRLQLSTTAECIVAELTADGPGAQQVLAATPAGASWTRAMQPFELAAIAVAQPDVTVRKLDAEFPDSVDLALNARIEDVGARAAALANQPELQALANPGFESLGPPDALTGWSLVSPQGIEATLDSVDPQSGTHALRLSSTRQVASLQSELIDAPSTGRLAVKVWLRAESTHRQPVLRLALEGPNDGKTYYRYAPVGGHGPGSVPLQTEWNSYIFQVDDLPPEGCEQMRVRFDLMGPGTVWIDGVELYQLKFSKNERVELSKILESARRALNSGELADCRRLLQGYWPRFLEQHVAAAEPQLARQARLPRRPTSPPRAAQDDPGPLDRLKGVLPKWPF